MADDTAVFAFDIDPNGGQQGADAVADSVDNLVGKIDEGTAALAEMNKAMRLLKGGSSVDVQAFKELRDAITAKKTSLAQLSAQLVQTGKLEDLSKNKQKAAADLAKQQALDNKAREKAEKQREQAARKAAADAKKRDDDAKKAQKEALDAFKVQSAAMQTSIAELGGPLGGILSQFQGLSSILGAGALLAGTLALVAAFAALTVGILTAAAALAKYGLAAADARRSELLQLEGLTKVRNWYGIAAGKATDLQAAIDRTSDSVALGREHINGMAASLYQLGMRGDTLSEALLGIETATSVAGEAQGAFYKNLIFMAGRSGASIKKVTDDIKARFGDLAARQMLSLDVQGRKLRENFARLFADVRIEGFLKALNAVTQLFSQNTAEGRALKQILEVAFNPFFDAVSAAAPLAKKFFQGLILAGQEFVITVLVMALAFKKTFKDSSVLGGIDKLKLAVNAGRVVFALLLGVVLGTAAAMTILAVATGIVLSPFIIFGLALYKAYNAMVIVLGAIGQLTSKFEEATGSWSGLGKALITGLVNGILGGIPSVISAVTNLGGAARDALKRAWDSHSPSRLAARIGLDFGRGTGLGVQSSIPEVEDAAKDMGKAGAQSAEVALKPPSPPAVRRQDPPAPPPSGGPSGGASGGVVNHWSIQVHANDEAGGRAAAKAFKEELGDAFTGLATKLGAPKRRAS